MQTSPPLPVVASLAALLEGLLEAVWARYGVFPIRGPLFRFLWKRLDRIQRHFACLAARFAAGKDLGPRPSRKRAARGPRYDQAFRLRAWVSPKFGWLCRIAGGSIGASAFAWSLRELLTTDPEMLALLAATPATARILRPLCWMLGVAEPNFQAVLPSVAPREPASDADGAEDPVAPNRISAMPRTTAPPMAHDRPMVVFPDPVLRAA